MGRFCVTHTILHILIQTNKKKLQSCQNIKDIISLSFVVAVSVHDGSFLVVDFLRFFVAEEEDDSAEEKDWGSPRHPVRPAELPHRPLTFLHDVRKADRVDDEGEEDGNHWRETNDADHIQKLVA